MAGADYKHCDFCGRKAFYDAKLAYTEPDKDELPFLEVGESQCGFKFGLGNLGDWAVLCSDCAKTHKTAIVSRGCFEGELT